MSTAFINAANVEKPSTAHSVFELRPALNTKITDQGKVVFRDRTRYGLHRMCVATEGKYPDLETWLRMLDATADPKLYYYAEKTVIGDIFIGYLWLFWKQ